MSNQQSHWNNIHQVGGLRASSEKVSGLATEALEYIKPNGDLLELGCGAGNDAVFLAQNGQRVVATDFAQATVDENKKIHTETDNLEFRVLDIKALDTLEDSSFDTIYARLSLHYFTDEETRKIFETIYRKLRPNGKIIFICKSTEDPLYGQGEQIEQDMFNLNGHIRHFFSEGYVKSLLGNSFKELKIESVKEDLYGHPSAYIKVIAERK